MAKKSSVNRIIAGTDLKWAELQSAKSIDKLGDEGYTVVLGDGEEFAIFPQEETERARIDDLILEKGSSDDTEQDVQVNSSPVEVNSNDNQNKDFRLPKHRMRSFLGPEAVSDSDIIGMASQEDLQSFIYKGYRKAKVEDVVNGQGYVVIDSLIPGQVSRPGDSGEILKYKDLYILIGDRREHEEVQKMNAEESKAAFDSTGVEVSTGEQALYKRK